MTPLDYYENVEKKSKDHVATPRWVVTQMYELINISQFRNVWFPFNNYDSEFKLKADELNLEYKATHLFNDLRQDFFTTEPPEDCELLISNPPFSLQNQIIKRTFDLADSGKIKAFALLLPLSTLETPFRADLWQRHESKLAVLIFKKRIVFKGKKSSFNTAVCWITWNVPTIHQKLAWLDEPEAKQ